MTTPIRNMQRVRRAAGCGRRMAQYTCRRQLDCRAPAKAPGRDVATFAVALPQEEQYR